MATRATAVHRNGSNRIGIRALIGAAASTVALLSSAAAWQLRAGGTAARQTRSAVPTAAYPAGSANNSGASADRAASASGTMQLGLQDSAASLPATGGPVLVGETAGGRTLVYGLQWGATQATNSAQRFSSGDTICGTVPAEDAC